MKANELRRVFQNYFEGLGHERIESASLIPHDDSLLFVNSGMVPFKPYFLGNEIPSSQRAVTVQKCVRAGGKHNDLDEVGRTSRHLTFFEMMGNFSFGDYFKEDAIPFAWEFVTQHLNLDPERLWVTVHLSDDEAADIWHEKVGVPRERIQRLDEDNWWRMADTGPNGPCSEIFWDKGVEYGDDGGPAHGGEDRFVEIWNLVFMQFETDENGDSHPLPKPSIDTGAGLERILAVLQNKATVFEIDEMALLIEAAEQVTGYKLGASESADLALRVLAEHSRTMTFLISDGVFPSNEDRGYVLRRIMRRAIRFAYLLGVEDTVTPSLVDAVVKIMGPDYPELVESHELVVSVVEREEVQFRETLATGSKILAEHLSEVPAGGQLDGAVAFTLHDTYGFPFEVTEEVVSEAGITLDRAGFDAAMQQQREKSKGARKDFGTAQDAADIQKLVEAQQTTEFVGREFFVDVEATVLYASEPTDGKMAIVCDKTPFYAESGGQIGDTGMIKLGVIEAKVLDTVYAAPEIVKHVVEAGSADFKAGDRVVLSIDVDRRDAIRRNHTGTHMLHWGLRQVLGDHVKQQGSWVGPDRLRFDFSHFEPVTDAELNAIEDLVNAEILANPVVSHEEMTKAQAQERGAIAFFGDKYGETVRVLSAGPSLEFCGGTHVRNGLGDIGCIKIVSEGSIGSNLRRIEAVTGIGVVELVRNLDSTVTSAAALMNVAPAELAQGIERQKQQISDLKDQLAGAMSELALGRAAQLAERAKEGRLIERLDGMARDDLANIAKTLVKDDRIEVCLLGGAPSGGGAALVAAVKPGADYNAGDLIAVGAKAIKGGGGKGQEFAMAGGKDAEGIDEALETAKKTLG